MEAVVISFNQGNMILEAVRSLQRQTTPPAKIIVVDDGSTDKDSVRILRRLESDFDALVPVVVIRQPNRGVSGARNAGIRKARTPFVLVLDGDDSLEPSYIEQISRLLREHPSMIAASSWMRTFGVLNATICPDGGNIASFCVRNCCPATHIFRRELWERCGCSDGKLKYFMQWTQIRRWEKRQIILSGIRRMATAEWRLRSGSRRSAMPEMNINAKYMII